VGARHPHRNIGEHIVNIGGRDELGRLEEAHGANVCKSLANACRAPDF
jgi:hypothetical protein